MPEGISAARWRPPKVSVVVTNYNYSRYVTQALQSICRQTYKNFECIVVDDCSTDGSFDVISQFLRDIGDDRFRSIRLGKNQGQMGAIKAGVENISGTFVTLMDADDVLADDFLQTHLSVHLNSSYSAAVTASDTYQIDSNGCILESTFHTLVKHRSNLPGGPVKPIRSEEIPTVTDNAMTFPERDPNLLACYVDRTLDGWHVVAMSSLMFRRDVLNLIMPAHTQELRICADYYLVCFAHALGGTVTISKSLSFFRLHQGNNFSFNIVVGGPHSPGYFPDVHRSRIHREIARHVILNYDRLSKIVDWSLCKVLIRKGIARHQMFRETAAAPHVRGLFGSNRAFMLKYGLFYRLLKKA